MRRMALQITMIAILLGACGGSSPEATPTALPPTPTAVPPTATPIVYTVPKLVTQYIGPAQSIFLDTFDTLSADWTYSSASVTTSLGEVQLTGIENWGTNLYHVPPIAEGTALLLRFRADSDAEFGAFLESGTWGKADYKRFGLYGPYPTTNIFHGTIGEPQQEFDGELSIESNAWYDMMLAVEPGGEFIALVWDPEDPSMHLAYRRVVDEKWAGSTWAFGITMNRGFLAIDEFVGLAFDDPPS